jgi:hypothetical protein
MITRTIHDETETEDAATGRDLYIANLVRGASGATEPAPTESEPVDGDGLPLSGYDRFCHNLTHPKAKTASAGKAGSNVR